MNKQVIKFKKKKKKGIYEKMQLISLNPWEAPSAKSK